MVALSTLDADWEIPLGTPVITADGRHIGIVTEADVYELLVEDEEIARRVYALNLIDVERYQGGTLRLKLTTEETLEQRSVGQVSFAAPSTRRRPAG